MGKIHLFFFDTIGSQVNDRSSFFRVHSINKNEAAQPGGKTERPSIENLLLGDYGTFVHDGPNIEHS